MNKCESSSERLGEEISNIVVEAKNLADRMVLKAKNKVLEREKELQEEQDELRALILKTGDHLRSAIFAYRQMSDELVYQMDELCERFAVAEEKLTVRVELLPDENEELLPDAVPAEVEAFPEILPKPAEDYSEKLMEALKDGEE